jgi:hypothetical protein
MTDPHPRSWQNAYEAAVLETNQALMPEPINEAVKAIHVRSDAPDQIEGSEVRSLADAQMGLHALKAERTEDSMFAMGRLLLGLWEHRPYARGQSPDTSMAAGATAFRRFGCLEVTLALFLTQQTSALGAQTLSPQSQPTQSAESASPPPTQSQAPPCSDAPPILKRGIQLAPPPCPDPPPAASPPAASVPTRSLTLIDKAREAAFEFSEKLPDFICKEFMARSTQRGRSEEIPLDVVSAEIIYANAQESYRDVKIDGRSTAKSLQEIGGSWSTGEFASTLLELFRPDTGAKFRSGGASPISGFSTEVYDFQVRSENSHWRVLAGSQTLAAAYGGSVWVDPKTARVLRIEMQARSIPSDFPMDTIESAVDYSNVMIGGTSFLLPVHAESLGCERGTSNCSHNIIDFRNYHEYKVDFKIGP